MRAVSSWMRFVIASLMLALLAACQPSEQKSAHQEEEYVMVASSIALPYWQEVRRGFEDSARELGIKARFIGTPGHNPPQQLKLFTVAASERPAGMLVAPGDPDLFKDAINGAMRNGISVFCVDTDSPASSRLLFIGTSNYEAGVQGGGLLAQALNGRGKVILLTIPQEWSLEERVLGYQDTLKKYPNIKIVGILDDAADPGRAAAAVTEALHKHPDLRGIGALDAAGGPGAGEALKKAGKTEQVTIVAMDKDRPTLDLIREGVILATIAQKNYTMSYYGLKLLHDLHHDSVRMFIDWRLAQISPLPARIDTGVAIIDRNNVAAFLR